MCTRYIPGPGARGSVVGSQGRHLHGRERDMDRGKFEEVWPPQKKTRPSKDRKEPWGFKSPHRPLTTPVLEPANNVHILVVFVQNEST